MLLRHDPFSMSLGQSDLLTRIESWTQEVESYTRQCKRRIHSSKPPSLAPRETLREITSNSRPRKRKPSTMPGSKDKAVNAGKKKIKVPAKVPDDIGSPTRTTRGRPPNQQPAPSNHGPLPRRGLSSSSIPMLPPPAKPASTTRSRSTSPRKPNIDMNYLFNCKPRVVLQTYEDLREEGGDIPDSVRLLYERLDSVPTNAIPSELRVGENPCPSQSLLVRVTLTSNRIPTLMMLTLLVKPRLLQAITSTHLPAQQLYHWIGLIP